MTHEFTVNCLRIERAAGIARTLLGPENLIQASPGSRTLRVQATGAQFAELQAALAAAQKSLGTCDNTPGR